MLYSLRSFRPQFIEQGLTGEELKNALDEAMIEVEEDVQVDDLDLRITAASLIDFTEEEWAKLGVTTKLVGDHFIQTADIRVDGASEGNAFARVRHYFFRPIATKADREQLDFAFRRFEKYEEKISQLKEIFHEFDDDRSGMHQHRIACSALALTALFESLLTEILACSLSRVGYLDVNELTKAMKKFGQEGKPEEMAGTRLVMHTLDSPLHSLTRLASATLLGSSSGQSS